MTDKIKIAGIAAIVVGLVLALMAVHHHIYKQGYEAGKAEVQAKFDAAVKDAEVKRLADVQAAKLEGERRWKAQQENTNEAIQQVQRAAADAATARTANQRLLSRIAGLERAIRAARDSAAVRPGPGEQGGDPLDVLVGVLQRTGDAAGQLSDYADKLKVAGLKCERDYDALTPAR
jgi:hypothetical protein